MRRYGDVETLDTRIARRFPGEFVLADKTHLTITPMVPSDWEFLDEFLASISRDERSFVQQKDFTNDQVLYWCSPLNYEHVLPLLGWERGRIVTYAILERDHNPWNGDCGRGRLIVHPHYRRRGIGSVMVRELIAVAKLLNQTELEIRCTMQTASHALLRRMGFRRAKNIQVPYPLADGRRAANVIFRLGLRSEGHARFDMTPS